VFAGAVDLCHEVSNRGVHRCGDFLTPAKMDILG
jgi:hypothetical protein